MQGAANSAEFALISEWRTVRSSYLFWPEIPREWEARRLGSRALKGTPSRHLFDDAITASKGTVFALNGMAPKALMASIRRRRPCEATVLAMDSMGLRIPDVVSQWTTSTWVIVGSETSALSKSLTEGGVSSGVSRLIQLRPR